MSRSAHLVGKLWNRSKSLRSQPEGFLEDALAAVMEAPGVWQAIRSSFDWPMPDETPKVSTQDHVEGGISDIRLSWETGQQLVIELKVWNPPSESQLQQYSDENVYLAAFAAFPASYALPRCFGAITWGRLTQVEMINTPLEWRQLVGLIHQMGVAVPRLELPALSGLIPTWGAWQALEKWIRPAAESLAASSTAAGLPCVCTEKQKGSQKLDESNGRFAAWVWPPPWRNGLGFFVGMFIGRDGDPVLVPGLPDLVLAFHLDPASREAEALLANETISESVSDWQAGNTSGEARELRPHKWELLRIRQSTLILLSQKDQGKFIQEWSQAAFQGFVDAGLVNAVVQASKPSE